MVCSLFKVLPMLSVVSLLWCPSMGGVLHSAAADAHKTPSLSRSAFVVTSSLKLLSSLLLLNSFAAAAFVLLQ